MTGHMVAGSRGGGGGGGMFRRPGEDMTGWEKLRGASGQKPRLTKRLTQESHQTVTLVPVARRIASTHPVPVLACSLKLSCCHQKRGGGGRSQHSQDEKKLNAGEKM